MSKNSNATNCCCKDPNPSGFFKITYLLNFFFVSLLQTRDVIGTLLGLLNLLPSFHLFLFEEGNTIGEQLGIALNAIKVNKS